MNKNTEGDGVWYIKWMNDTVYVFSNDGEYCEQLK